MDTKLSLVIDGSGSAVFTGLLTETDQWLAKVERPGAPLEELFPAVEAALKKAGIRLSDVNSYLYCEGPGSVLGLRLCAMAIETWTRLYPQSAQLYKYNSLQLTALSLLDSKPELHDALIVSDWKKGAWNALYIKEGIAGTTEVIDDEAMAAWEGALYHMPQRKGWQSPPANAVTLNYDPAQIDKVRHHPSLLQATEGVELYSSGINTFQKWTPTRHRAQA
ncbi:MAG: tRNA threonylcarbamoyladenosine biosynthesis protein TsaB [Candidatus Azotimanducaceae bacterium]|jgi:tRNA threonylcarbamoyladenosine biosynthesis protein TsaB